MMRFAFLLLCSCGSAGQLNPAVLPYQDKLPVFVFVDRGSPAWFQGRIFLAVQTINRAVGKELLYYGGGVSASLLQPMQGGVVGVEIVKNMGARCGLTRTWIVPQTGVIRKAGIQIKWACLQGRDGRDYGESLVLHELIHALGVLDHSAEGLMSKEIDRTMQHPMELDDWALKQLEARYGE